MCYCFSQEQTKDLIKDAIDAEYADSLAKANQKESDLCDTTVAALKLIVTHQKKLQEFLQRSNAVVTELKENTEKENTVLRESYQQQKRQIRILKIERVVYPIAAAAILIFTFISIR